MLIYLDFTLLKEFFFEKCIQLSDLREIVQRLNDVYLNGTGKANNLKDEFGIWYIHGNNDYINSIRLEISDYMVSFVEK